MRIKMTDEIRQFFNCYISNCCSLLRWANNTAKLETLDFHDVKLLISNTENLVEQAQRIERYLKNRGVPKVYVDDFGREVTFEKQFLDELENRNKEGNNA